MPTKGQIIVNPINGEHNTLKIKIKSKGQLVPDYYHTLQEELFEVILGQLTIFLDGSMRRKVIP